MEITEVRIKLMEDSEDRLRAFCSITFDHCFVIRDLKIIEGTSGPFVAMPSRKLTGRCNRCGCKNHLRSNYCNQCGSKLRGGGEPREVEGAPNKLYADIAHPIKQSCRDQIQEAVVLEYAQELQRAKLPGYVSRYDDDYLETPPMLNPHPVHLPLTFRWIHLLPKPRFPARERTQQKTDLVPAFSKTTEDERHMVLMLESIAR